MKHTILTDFRTDLADRVRAELAIEATVTAAYGYVVVAVEGTKTVLEDLTAALAPISGSTRAGLAVIVGFPRLNRPEPNLPGPPGGLKPSLIVACNPLINNDTDSGTLILPETLAHFLASRLHQVKVNEDTSMLINDVQNSVKPAQIEGVPLAFEVPFECHDVTDSAIQQCANVVATPASGAASTVALTCGTAGASIYYTTAGALPGKNLTGATLYSTPITVPAPGFTLRAAAYKAGLIGSDVLQSVFTQA